MRVQGEDLIPETARMMAHAGLARLIPRVYADYLGFYDHDRIREQSRYDRYLRSLSACRDALACTAPDLVDLIDAEIRKFHE